MSTAQGLARGKALSKRELGQVSWVIYPVIFSFPFIASCDISLQEGLLRCSGQESSIPFQPLFVSLCNSLDVYEGGQE